MGEILDQFSDPRRSKHPWHDIELRGLVIGTLRQEGVPDETVIPFTADHGNMLGTHGLWRGLHFPPPRAGADVVVGTHGG